MSKDSPVYGQTRAIMGPTLGLAQKNHETGTSFEMANASSTWPTELRLIIVLQDNLNTYYWLLH
jgi:hypothetical protein